LFIHHRLKTSYGPVRCSAPDAVTIPANPDEALRFASRVDREADALLAEGQVHRAEQLAHLALEARCRATGARA